MSFRFNPFTGTFESGLTFPDLATPPANTALGSSGAPYIDAVLSGYLFGAISGRTTDIDASTFTPTLAGVGAGNVDNGAHRYKFIYSSQNTPGGSQTADSGNPTPTVTVVDKSANGKVSVAIPATNCNSNLMYVNIYRQDGGSGSYKFVGSDNWTCSTTFLDNVANASLGAVMPTVNTTESANAWLFENGSFHPTYNANWEANVWEPSLPGIDFLMQFPDNPSGKGGLFELSTGTSIGGDGGSIQLSPGYSRASDYSYVTGGGNYIFHGGTPTTGGYFSLTTGNGGSGDTNGGSAEIVGGSSSGAGHLGDLSLNNWRQVLSDSPWLIGNTVTATDFIVSGSRFKSDTTNAHTGGLAVYDVDDAAYKDFLVWTNANAPAVVLSTPAGGTFSGDFSSLTIASVAVSTQTYVNSQGFITTVGASSGTGNLVRVTGATLVTPMLGAALATSINGNTFTTGTYTLTGAAGKTLTFSNSLTLAGTDSTTMTFPSTSATMARTDAANSFTGTQTFVTNGALSAPVFSLTGTWIATGGTATTTKPYVLIEPSGTASTAWHTSGTGLGVNAASGLAGNLIDLQVAAVSWFSVGKESATAYPVIYFRNGGATSTIGLQGIRGVFDGLLIGDRFNQGGGTLIGGGSIALTSVGLLQWTNGGPGGPYGGTADTFLSRPSAATIQMGADINGAAVAQTFQSCRGITGADKNGAPFHFVAGPGTGAATVSYIDFTTPTVTTTGTTQQTGVVRATISSTGLNATVPIAFGGNLAISNAVPTISSGFGSGATIAGIAGGFRITCGTAPGVGGTVAFNATYANAPVCFVQDETTGILGIAAPTTTTVVISGLTLLSGQTVAVFVFGY